MNSKISKLLLKHNIFKNEYIPVTNITTLLITIYGTVSPFYSAEIFMAGLFGLSGGLTNWFAVHMLFEKVLPLIGSGVFRDSKSSRKE